MSDSRASGAVTNAVRTGLLPPVTTQRCVDCGAVATAYDHYKGYAREHWLDVQPVCTRHNVLRGKSKPARTHDPADPVSVLMRIPQHLLDALGAEAEREHRSRTQQLNRILMERYGKFNRDGEGEAGDGTHIRETGGIYQWRAA